MLPATLVTFATFVLELCLTSPVYNMQPAFITTNIGATTGRNIRNLPCISRKNNGQSGVCMFAIDCLKANGTHLGTCIDRFYFGSCCHIEPVHNIVENTIESDIIPHDREPPESDIIPHVREPPERMANTTKKPILSTSVSPSLNTGGSSVTFSSSSNSSSTSKISVISSSTVSPLSSSTTENSTRFSDVSNNYNIKNESILSTTVRSSSPLPTTHKISSSTLTANEATTKATLSSRPFGERIPPLTVTNNVETTTTAQKLQTFQIVQGSSTIATTTAKTTSTKITKPSITNGTVKTTIKPSTVTTRPSKPRPRPTKPNTTQKPIRTTKPTSYKPTQKHTKPTSKPTKTVKPSTTGATIRIPTKRPLTTIRTTAKPTTIKISSKPSVFATKQPSTSSTTQGSTTVFLPEIPIDKVNITNTIASGNTATNEIDPPMSRPIEVSSPLSSLMTSSVTTSTTTISSTPTVPGLVTWTVADNKNHTVTTVASTDPEVANITTEDWVPITTPDGWVLLPSVTSTTSSTINDSLAIINVSTVPSVSSEATSPTTQTSSSTSSPSSSLEISTTPSSNFDFITEVSLSALNTTVLTSTSSVSEVIVTDGIVTTLPVSDVTPIVTEPGSAGPAAKENVTSAENVNILTTQRPDVPVNMSDFTDVCGRRMFPQARIVGGEKSLFGKWPWQISLRQWRTSTYLHKCGAALLNENWAITAAHCVDNVPPSDLLLRLGEHDLSTDSEPYLHQERRVQIVASHPQFDPRTFEYDLALLRFYEPVTFQPNILPVCVPQTDESFVGRTAHVTGWGRLYEDGPLPSVLQEVSVPVINNSVCESMYRSAGYIEHIPHIFICAGWRRGGFDSCEGDSGGPMVIQREDKRFLLAGVISWGIGCAEPNQPGVYTRISEFRDWINQILQF